MTRRPSRCVPVLCLAAILVAPLSGRAAPVPGSLRADRVGASVHLTWELGVGPFGVYRSGDPTDVLRPAWLQDIVLATSYDDPIRPDDPSLTVYLVDDPIPCTFDPECDDLDLCNGAERCTGARLCESGTPVLCGDNDACTMESCNPATGGCDSAPLDCDDADPCTLDRCDPVSGCDHAVDPLFGVGVPAELAGRSLSSFPLFEFTRVFNEGSDVEIAIDPSVHPHLVGSTCDVYLVAARDAGQWCSDSMLTDVRGAPDTVTIGGAGVAGNRFTLGEGPTLSGDGGLAIGVGYDVVLDCNRNRMLDADERIDGLSDEAGLYVVDDLTGPGPLTVSSFDDIGPEPAHCAGGGNDDMRIYYPALLDDPGHTGAFPLVVISHGNGHCYDWYDFLGTHLASHGYVVMSHDNDTVPGIETASETTLLFTDKILREQGTLGGGVLAGHIDSRRIAWIGHSRGGEGVVRAYDRLVDEAWPSEFYTADDIVLISSIAPTDFLGPSQSDPHGVAYHLLYGSADGDVCGCPNNAVAQSFSLLERATGAKQSTYVHGADHNDFNCCGFDDFQGPPGTAIGRPEAQQVQKAATLAVVERFLDREPAPEDYLWRQYEALRPLGVDPSTVVVHEFREHPGRRSFVIDDFQSEPSDAVSSSGGAVTGTVTDLVEDRQRETDSSFGWTGLEPMNGMTRGRVEDLGRGVVFDFAAAGDGFLEFAVVPGESDFSDDAFVSFRAAQGTRHPETVATLEDLDFTVTLRDGAGNLSSIAISTYGGGVEEPYQRSGFGAGDGWQNEQETIRIRLTDFTRDGTPLDLTDIRAVRFEFGSTFGSPEGRVALDDLELTKE